MTTSNAALPTALRQMTNANLENADQRVSLMLPFGVVGQKCRPAT